MSRSRTVVCEVTANFHIFVGLSSWGRLDSNQRPTDYEFGVLGFSIARECLRTPLVVGKETAGQGTIDRERVAGSKAQNCDWL